MTGRLRRHAARALLGFCAGAAIGWAISATARGAEATPPAGDARALGAGDTRTATARSACALGRWCTGTAGCAGDCDPATSLISGCARCVKGAFAGCSQGECQAALDFPAAAAVEPLCPNQLMTPCPTVREMCTIGRTSHRCQCSPVGVLQHPKWICK